MLRMANPRMASGTMVVLALFLGGIALGLIGLAFRPAKPPGPRPTTTPTTATRPAEADPSPASAPADADRPADLPEQP